MASQVPQLGDEPRDDSAARPELPPRQRGARFITRRTAWIAGAAALIVAAAVAVPLSLGSSPPSRPRTLLPPGGPRVIGVYAAASYGLAGPSALATDNGHLWVLSSSSGTVSELADATGALLRTVNLKPYGGYSPSSIADDGMHLWITGDGAGVNSGSLIELDTSNGGLVQSLESPDYALNTPSDVITDGPLVWVANESYNSSEPASVTEISAADGHQIQTLSSGAYGFDYPLSLAVQGGNLWVANGGPQAGGPAGTTSVSELDTTSGAPERRISKSAGFDEPYGIAVYGSSVWVINNQGNSVTEIDAASGAIVRTLAGARYGFDRPYSIAVTGSNAWVTNYGGNSVTEFNASTGAWERTLPGSAYHFDQPDAIAVDGSRLWVANDAGGKDGYGSVVQLAL